MITPQDQQFLRRALRLAMNGRGRVEPNPMVGCVLAKNGQIIGEGWHAEFGGAHAEPNALEDCKRRGNDAAGATAYVTLEPCCHTRKKTPPCAPRLVEARVTRVVIGCLDPNIAVNGNGVAALKAAGIAVDVLPSPPGTGERELDGSHFQQLIAPFAGIWLSHDTYVTLKWAEDAEGLVAGPGGVRSQISNAASQRLVHQLRARSAQLVVGIGTVLADDPQLNVRGIAVARQPQRLVLDRELKLPAGSKLIATARDGTGGSVIVLCAERTYFESPRVAELQSLGVKVREQRSPDLRATIDMDKAFSDEQMAHGHILVEPGPTLARALLPTADRLWVFRSPKKIAGGPTAPRAAAIPDHYVTTGTLDLAGDTLTEYLNTNSPAFFAAMPSADFVLAAESVARATSP